MRFFLMQCTLVQFSFQCLKIILNSILVSYSYLYWSFYLSSTILHHVLSSIFIYSIFLKKTFYLWHSFNRIVLIFRTAKLNLVGILLSHIYDLIFSLAIDIFFESCHLFKLKLKIVFRWSTAVPNTRSIAMIYLQDNIKDMSATGQILFFIAHF